MGARPGAARRRAAPPHGARRGHLSVAVAVATVGEIPRHGGCMMPAPMMEHRRETTTSGNTTRRDRAIDDGVLRMRAKRPLVCVPRDLTVMAALRLMAERKVGAL